MDYLAYLWYCFRQLPIYHQYMMISGLFGTLIAIFGLSLAYITYNKNQSRENTKRNFEDLNQLGTILNRVRRQFREYPEFKSNMDAHIAKELVFLLKNSIKPPEISFNEWRHKYEKRTFLYSLLDALGELENLSIRVNMEEVDIKMIYRSSGEQIISFYELIEELIIQMQQAFDALTFREFEIMVDRLREFELKEKKSRLRGYPYIKVQRVERKPLRILLYPLFIIWTITNYRQLASYPYR